MSNSNPIIINQLPQSRFISKKKTINKKLKKCKEGKLFLYRIWFKYKSNFSGDNYVYLEGPELNMFNDSYQSKIIEPGDIVKYKPVNPKHPNYNARAKILEKFITSDTGAIKNPYNIVKKMYTYNIEFTAPPIINGKVIKYKKYVKEKELEKIDMSLIKAMHISNLF